MGWGLTPIHQRGTESLTNPYPPGGSDKPDTDDVSVASSSSSLLPRLKLQTPTLLVPIKSKPDSIECETHWRGGYKHMSLVV